MHNVLCTLYTDISVSLGQTWSDGWLNTFSHRPYTSVVLTHSHPNYSAVDVHAEDKLVPNMYGTNSLHTQYGTPLTFARSKGHDHIVQLLREANRQR